MRKTSVRRFLMMAAVLAGLAAAAGGTRAADQPQWGQRYTRNMVSDEANLPDTFDPATGKNIKWIVPLGTQCYASPTVAQGRVFIGTNNKRPRNDAHKGDRGALWCLDEKTGEFLWQLLVPKRADPYEDWSETGMCSPPTIEGDNVYLIANRGEAMCLDIHGQAGGNRGPFTDEGRHLTPANKPAEEIDKTDADIIWLLDLFSAAGVHQHDDAHCSPLLHGQFLYLNTSNGVDNTHKRIPCPDAPALIVLDKATGKLLARDEEHMAPRTIHCTWSSPSLGEVNGKAVIFLGGPDGVCYAFEALTAAPADGKVARLKCLWKVNCDPNSPQGDVFAWQENRQQGPSNITAMPVFHEGKVYVTAGGDFWHGKPEAYLRCLDAATGKESWCFVMSNHCMSTPAIRDGLLFVCDCHYRPQLPAYLHCVDLATGKELWRHQAKGPIWGSPLVADGKVFFGSRAKDFWILAAGREKKVLGQVDLDSPISGTPTAANGTLYIPTMKQLYAVRKKEQ